MPWIFLRHGEALHNVIAEKALTSERHHEEVLKIADHKIELTENGIQQARRAGNAIRERYGSFDQVVHTGYKRSEDTLRYILEAYSVEERVQMRTNRNFHLRERSSGYVALMSKDEAAWRFPWMEESKKVLGPLFFRPPGGESIDDLINRTSKGLTPLLGTSAQRNVLFVVHGWTIVAVRSFLEGWANEEIEEHLIGSPTANCGAVIYNYNLSSGRLVYDGISFFS